MLWFWNFIGDTLPVRPENTAFSVMNGSVPTSIGIVTFQFVYPALFPKLNISLKRNQIVSVKYFQNIVTRPLKDL